MISKTARAEITARTREALVFLGTLEVGDAVTVAEGARTLPDGLYVSRALRSVDPGGFGDPHGARITVTYGPGRYAFEVAADAVGNGRYTIARA